MKKLYALTLLLFTINIGLSAQTFSESWAKTAGGTGMDEGKAVAFDPTGFVYIAGNFSSASINIGTTTLSNNGGSDIFIAKYDTAGNFIWARQFGGTGDETVKSISVAADGSIYLADTFSASIDLGPYSFSSAGQTDIYLAKLNGAGAIQWAKQIGSASPQTIPDVVTDSRSFVYISGQGNAGLSIDGTPVPAGDCFVAKVAPNGDLLRIKSISTLAYAQTDELFNIAIDAQDNLHVSYYYGFDNGGNGTPVIPGPSYQSRSVFDSAGTSIVTESISRQGTLPQARFYGVSYRARRIDDYTTASQQLSASLDGIIKLQGHLPAASSITDFSTSNLVSCLGMTNHNLINAARDNNGNIFLAGNYKYAFCMSPADPVIYKFSNSLQLSSSTSMDIFIASAGYTGGASNLYSTIGNGNTSEAAAGMALDPVGKAIYVIGNWSKIIDTSLFRFGSSVLSNPGAINTNDVLFLKLSYSGSSLAAHAGADRTICAGGTASLTGSAGGSSGVYAYSWSPSAGLNNASVFNPIARPAVTTDYVLKVTDNLGNTSWDTVRVIIDSNIYRPVISLNSGSINPFCEGSQVELMSSAAATYQWSTGSINSFLVLDHSDTVTVTAVRNDGCTGVSLPFIVTMLPRTETPVISPVDTVSVCTTFATLTAQNTQTPVSYEWSTGETTDSITVVSPGIYSVIATGTSGCVSLPASKTILGKPTGFITSSGNQTFCNGDSVQLTIHTALENSVAWSNGDSLMSIWVKSSDDYTVMITTPEGCSDMALNDVFVTVIAPPAAPVVVADGPTSFCDGGNVNLKIQNTDPDLNYEWNTGNWGDTLYVDAGGAYRVWANDIFGCRSDITEIVVNENPYPDATVMINGSNSICQGDSVLLTIQSVPQGNYLWNNGATSASIWVKSAGNYSALITTTAGCSANTSNSIPVSVKPVPVPVVIQTGNHLSVSPATSTYQWYMNDSAIAGAVGIDLDIARGGMYRVQATANGCTASETLTVILRNVAQDITYQVYPNPVVNDLNIVYSLKQSQRVSVTIHDVTGRTILQIVNHEMQAAGDHAYSWKGSALRLQKGSYFVVFEFSGRKYVQQVVVL